LPEFKFPRGSSLDLSHPIKSSANGVLVVEHFPFELDRCRVSAEIEPPNDHDPGTTCSWLPLRQETPAVGAIGEET